MKPGLAPMALETLTIRPHLASAMPRDDRSRQDIWGDDVQLEPLA
jgi:hypothetical protein